MPFPTMGDGMGDTMGDDMSSPSISSSPPVTGLSKDYHTFDDPNTDMGRILNKDERVVRYSEENAYGLGWNTATDWTGATVTVFAVLHYSDPPVIAPVMGMGFVDGTTPNLICYDFVGGPEWPAGDWVFYAKVVQGEDEDITSGILVTDKADLF